MVNVVIKGGAAHIDSTGYQQPMMSPMAPMAPIEQRYTAIEANEALGPNPSPEAIKAIEELGQRLNSGELY